MKLGLGPGHDFLSVGLPRESSGFTPEGSHQPESGPEHPCPVGEHFVGVSKSEPDEGGQCHLHNESQAGLESSLLAGRIGPAFGKDANRVAGP